VAFDNSFSRATRSTNDSGGGTDVSFPSAAIAPTSAGDGDGDGDGESIRGVVVVVAGPLVPTAPELGLDSAATGTAVFALAERVRGAGSKAGASACSSSSFVAPEITTGGTCLVSTLIEGAGAGDGAVAAGVAETGAATVAAGDARSSGVMAA